MTKEEIRQMCIGAGACAAGFAEAHPVPEDIAEMYRRWIASGHNGGMEYLARYDEVRRRPALLLDGAATIISCAFAYSRAGMPRSALFADYARGSDYHKVLRKALAPVAHALEASAPGSHTCICIDTAPLRERFWATQAGIGFIGLNNQLIVPGIGSHVFLAEILWTEAMTPDTPCTAHCSGCGACISSCPGTALDGKGGIDASRCLSYLTIEHRGELPEGVELPGRIYGCDICQDVCPHNAINASHAVLPQFMPTAALMHLTLDDILSLDAEGFARLFAHSAVKRVKLDGLRRNALRRRKY